MADAIVIGSGPNGLVAANVLADAGWSVLVLEAAPEPGGGVRSGELVEPGYVHDECSGFHPLAAASRHIGRLRLEEHGLRWRSSPVPVAHPAPDGSCPFVSVDLDETAAALDAFAPGDGEAWRRLYALWEEAGAEALRAVLTLFPPVRAGARLAARVGPGGLMRLLRFALLPVRRMGDESFRGEGGRRLLAGSALHADLLPEMPPSGAIGWALCALAQDVGFPAPEGGAGAITRALVARLERRGGMVVCDAPVEDVVVRRGRAVGIRAAGGEPHEARRALLADVDAPQLYGHLVERRHLPTRLLADLRHYEQDPATVKVNWALDAPIPWTSPDARRAGAVHVADDLQAMTRYAAELAQRLIPARPYLVMGQYAGFDPTRAPAGKDAAWAYTHVPQRTGGDAGGDLRGSWDERESARFADRMEAEVEALAPGFRDLIRGRDVQTPPAFEARNRNLIGGALNGGTTQLHQQLVFRPLPGLARPETPVRGLFLASASAHPGGGVHGACGANAARAALAHDRRRPGALLMGALNRRIQRSRPTTNVPDSPL